MQQCKRRWSQECCNHPAWPCKYQNILIKKCRHNFVPGYITPKDWSVNLGLYSRSLTSTFLYIFPSSKRNAILRPPECLHNLSLAKQGAFFSASVHWLSEQRMSQMASTNGPHEPIDPRKRMAKATMPRIIPIAPMIWTSCSNSRWVSYFVVLVVYREVKFL